MLEERGGSIYDNFLIFGANCDESSPVTKKHVKSWLPQLAELERAEFELEGIKYRFKLQEWVYSSHESSSSRESSSSHESGSSQVPNFFFFFRLY